MKNLTFLSVIVFALTVSVSAQAQDAPQQPVRATDVKSFGDWGVRCFPVSSQSPCEMLETITQKDSGRRLMSMSIGYAPKADRHIIQISLPLGVSLAKGVKIVADAYTSPPIQYRRCDRAGCYVEGFIDNTVLAGLTHGSPNAKIVIATADGRDITLPLSLRGFNDAHDAMTSLARAKVGAAPAAPASP
ncbi:MAG TPA: invasion associated locus B family protein [Rhizomicrobium sp.]